MKNFFSFQKKSIVTYFLCVIIIFSIADVLQSCEQKKPIEPIKKDNTAEIKRLTVIADRYYDELHEYEASYVYFKKIISLCDPEKNTADYIDALTSIAGIQQLAGDYVASEATATKALPYLKYMKKTRYAANIYNELGVIYSETYNYDNAILFFKKIVNLKTSTWRKSGALNNIGAVYMAQGKYKEAVDLFTMLLSVKYFPKSTFLKKPYPNLYDNDYARIMDNLGFCYFELGEVKKAIEYSTRGLKIRMRTKDHEGLAINYKHLSICYQKSDLKLAEKFAEKAYVEGVLAQRIESQIWSLKLLIKNNSGKDLKKYIEIYTTLKYNQYINQRKEKNPFARIKYDFENDKLENIQLKNQKAENELLLERQKTRTIISYLIIAFLLLNLTFLTLYIKMKSKKVKSKIINNNEARISKKLDDELIDDIYNIAQFANRTNLEQNKEYLLKNLETIYSKTRTISRENSHIVTDENFIFYLKEVIAGFKTTEINILSNGLDTIAWNKIDRNKKIILYRVIQELFANMKKHSRASLASITFKIIGKNILVNYTDNGAGIEDGRIILKNGLQNVENRIKTINGTVNFDINSEKGFKISFTFPL